MNVTEYKCLFHFNIREKRGHSVKDMTTAKFNMAFHLVYWSIKALLHVYTVRVFLRYLVCQCHTVNTPHLCIFCKPALDELCRTEHERELVSCWTVLKGFIKWAVNWEFERNGIEKRSALWGQLLKRFVFFPLLSFSVDVGKCCDPENRCMWLHRQGLKRLRLFGP